MSPHNPTVLFMAAQYFFKSTNRGDTWRMNPTDLTKNVPRWSPERPIMNVAGDKPMAEKHDGYSASSLITQVRESPSKPGIIWIGTDDGNLQTQPGWRRHLHQRLSRTSKARPKATSKSPASSPLISIPPPPTSPSIAIASMTSRPISYKTTDYGKTWTNVTSDLPKNGNVNALREDMENPNLLFAGTEFGLYVTLDGGKAWKKFMTGLPSVRVDDILIHPRDRDLIVATHGRSIWIADDITPLEHICNNRTQPQVTLLDPRPAVLWKNDVQAQRHTANREFVGKNPPGGTAIAVMSKTDAGAGKLEFLAR